MFELIIDICFHIIVDHLNKYFLAEVMKTWEAVKIVVYVDDFPEVINFEVEIM